MLQYNGRRLYGDESPAQKTFTWHKLKRWKASHIKIYARSLYILRAHSMTMSDSKYLEQILQTEHICKHNESTLK